MPTGSFQSLFSRIIPRNESSSKDSDKKVTRRNNLSPKYDTAEGNRLSPRTQSSVGSSHPSGNNRISFRFLRSPRNSFERNNRNYSNSTFKERRIARGTTCDVVLVMDGRLGKIVAKKIYTTDRDPSKDYRDNMAKVLQNEYVVLSKLKQSKFVVDAYAINLGSKTITMEYMPFSLSRVLFMDLYPTVAERKCYFGQICEAVRYLHSHGVIHRDLKLENIMICEDACKIKLVDFGVAVITESPTRLTDCKGICGTEALMAPEVLSTITYSGQPADCWSLGIILYQMFNAVRSEGRWRPIYPWTAARVSDKEFKKYSESGETFTLRNIEDDEDLKCLILQFLEIDVGARLTIDSILITKFISSVRSLKHDHDRTLRMCNRMFGVKNL